jgi:hypothetical protein
MNFSLHAMDVMEQREIMIEWVARVVDDPTLVVRDEYDPSLVRAFGPVPERDGRVLRVVYNPEGEGDSVWIVTTFFDRTMKGKL